MTKALACMLLTVSLLAARGAAAQMVDLSAEIQETPGKWAGELGIELSSKFGFVDQQGFSVGAGGGIKANKTAFLLGGKLNHYEVDNEDDSKTTLADDRSVRLSVDHDISEKWYLTNYDVYSQDELRELDMGLLFMAGVGLRIIKTDHVQLNLSLLGGHREEQRRDNQGDVSGPETIMAQTLQWKIKEGWSLQESFNYARQLGDRETYVIEGELSLVGMITKHIGMQLSYTYNYQDVLDALAIDPEQQSLTAGFKVKY